MKKTNYLFYMSLVLCLSFLVSCSKQQDTAPDVDGTVSSGQQEGVETQQARLDIVATTTMLQDLCAVVGGDKVQVTGLITVGIDPHTYEPSAKDSSLLENAQVIVYHGLHLEGKMTDVFSHMSQQGKQIIAIEHAIDPSQLLQDEEELDSPDPHIWFDPLLWVEACLFLSAELGTIDPENQQYYQENATAYVAELLRLDQYIKEEIEKIPAESRVLVTAHDAFQYFAQRYDFQVEGIQGIATNSEATTADIRYLADFIVENQIKAVFVETSVSSKNMEALQEAVAAQGFSLALGGTLYSDSLGEGEFQSYLASYRANIDCIVSALSP